MPLDTLNKVAEKLKLYKPVDISSPKGAGAQVYSELVKEKIGRVIERKYNGVKVKTGVLVANPNSDEKTQHPIAIICVFKQQINEDILTFTHQLCWSFCHAPLLIVIEPTLVRAFSCYERPIQQNQDVNNYSDIRNKRTSKNQLSLLNGKISGSKFRHPKPIMEFPINEFGISEEAKGAIDALQWVELISGNFFDKEKPRFPREQRADKTLLDNLQHIRDELHKDKNGVKGLDYDIIHALLARLIFIQFLFDRKDSKGRTAITQEYLSKLYVEKIFSDRHKNFEEILCNKNDAYAFFRELNKRFNGDLFPGDDEADWQSEIDKVDESHLKTLADLVGGRIHLKRNQPSFWKMYSFDAIPLELISSIYEEFVSQDQNAKKEKSKDAEKEKKKEKTKRRKTGVYYTKSHLVDFILDNVLPWKGEYDLKILDPSCGSGIFLVKAFQRLVWRWKYHKSILNKKYKPRELVQHLTYLLENNLFGVDIDPEAVRVASFSLYLAMCDEIDPRTLWENATFPDLRERQVIQRDFFGTSLLQVDDLLGIDRLLNKLKNKQDLLSLYLCNKLTSTTLELIEKFTSQDQPTEGLLNTLVNDFNKLLKDILFDEEAFIQVPLRQETKKLIEKNPQGEELIYLNRMLLEDAYPNEIARNHYLDEDKPLFKQNPDIKYDLIIGNAPWGRDTLNESLYAQKWAEKKDWKSSYKNLGPLFLPKAASLAKENGYISLIQPVLPLLTGQSDKAKQFRRRLFKEYQIEEIVNLSDFRTVLFKDANYPACIVTMRPTTPSGEPISYICPKRRGTDEDLRQITIEPMDENFVHLNEVIDKPWIWTTLMHGNRRDASLVARLQQKNSVAKMESENKASTRQGIISGDQKREKKGRILQSSDFPEGTFLVLEGDKLPIKKIKFHSRDSSGEHSFDSFKYPQVFIKHSSQRETKRFTASLVKSTSKTGVLCVRDFLNLHAEQISFLKSATLTFNSCFATYFLQLIDGEIGFSGRPKPSLNSFWQVPIPDIAEKYFEELELLGKKDKATALEKLDKIVLGALELSESEKLLIDDFFDYTLPDFIGSGRTNGREVTTRGIEPELTPYCETFIKVIKAGFGKDKKVRATIFQEIDNKYLPIRMIAIHLEFPERNRPIKRDKCESKKLWERLNTLNEKLMQDYSESGSILYQRVARIYDNMEFEGKQIPTVYLVKPDQKRYWLRSQALSDADEVSADIVFWAQQQNLNDVSNQNQQGAKRKKVA